MPKPSFGEKVTWLAHLGITCYLPCLLSDPVTLNEFPNGSTRTFIPMIRKIVWLLNSFISCCYSKYIKKNPTIDGSWQLVNSPYPLLPYLVLRRFYGYFRRDAFVIQWSLWVLFQKWGIVFFRYIFCEKFLCLKSLWLSWQNKPMKTIISLFLLVCQKSQTLHPVNWNQYTNCGNGWFWKKPKNLSLYNTSKCVNLKMNRQKCPCCYCCLFS